MGRIGILALAAAALVTAAGLWAQSRPVEPDDPPLSVYDDFRVRRTVDSDMKVTDGTLVKAGRLNAVVGITSGSDTHPRCTGTLIKSDIVLTAAHCICGLVIGQHGLPNSNILIGTGPEDPARQYYLATGFWSAMTCRNGEPVGALYGRDVGLVRLKNPAGVQPAPLASAPLIDAATSFHVAGFGAIDYNAVVYDYKKREAGIPSASNNCRGTREGVADSKVYGCQPGTEIVAGQRRSPDTCRGDSGGPLFVESGGKYLLAGVTSRSIPNTPVACGNGGIYERLGPATRKLINGGLAHIKPGTSL